MITVANTGIGLSLFLHMMINLVISTLYGNWFSLVFNHFFFIPMLIILFVSIVVSIERKDTELLRQYRSMCNLKVLLAIIITWPAFAFHLIYMDLVENNQSCTFD